MTEARRQRRARQVRLAWFALAVVGGLTGLGVLWIHLAGDPLADVRAYYDAGARLNAGLPLYPADANPNAAGFYRYPPLLAIAFRPLALLPYPAAAAIWEAVVIASLVGTLWWVGLRRRETWLAVGILGLPIAWCVAIGQAQVPLTFLTAIGAPWSIALAANLKLFPALVALWWIGRRDWRALAVFAGWVAGLALLQLVLAPQATLDFLGTLTLEQVGEVRNISPYAVSPLLWAVLVGAGIVLSLRLAPTRWGWVAAVMLSVVATPRLLLYMLMTCLAALRGAGSARSPTGTSGPPAQPIGG
ncbi:MAG: glycosyltransferase 87 family protein [Chloroflexota bacterium]